MMMGKTLKWLLAFIAMEFAAFVYLGYRITVKDGIGLSTFDELIVVMISSCLMIGTSMLFSVLAYFKAKRETQTSMDVS